MVPQTVRTGRGRWWRAAIAAAGALSLIAACRRGADSAAASDEDTPVGRAVAAVRDRYTARDAIASGAWAWTAPDSTVWVLVDVQSAVKDVVEARLDLWSGDAAGPRRIGRSDVMPAAAGFTGYAFEDLTGDGVPDFLGAVADSSGESFPVFIPGARGAMGDELELLSHGYRFASGEENLPQVLRGPRGACALEVWADEAADGAPPGWRYFGLGARGELARPTATAPTCP